MTRRSIDLASHTPSEWVNGILDDFDTFLPDHANCERKAAALAMSLVSKHPERSAIIPTLVHVAREELEHFADVYALMRRRGLDLVADAPDPYVNALMRQVKSGREARFLDRLLVSSVVECRGAERFGILANALEDRELKAFYTELWKAETKHGHQFADMALKCFAEDEVYGRLAEWMQIEAEVVAELPWRASLH